VARGCARADRRRLRRPANQLSQNTLNAFTTRIALTELAERSLDLQYCIWAPDTRGES